MTPVPVRKRHRLLFAIALLHLGKHRHDPAMSSRAAVIEHLATVGARYFDGATYPETIERAVDAAIEVERRGANNLFRGQMGFDDFEARI